MILKDYRVVLESGNCLKLWEIETDDGSGGVCLENVIEGKSVLMNYEEVREMVQVLTAILESE